MYVFGKVTVIPKIPDKIKRLEDLAYNLWWSWNTKCLRLFKDIDSSLWDKCSHNPVKFINNVSQEKLEAAANNDVFLSSYYDVVNKFDSYMKPTETWFSKKYPNKVNNTIAYFSAEYGLDETFPIYSGGLGILSGDHCKSASDLGIPFVAVGLFYRQGYFNQQINRDGWQESNFTELNIEELPIRPAMKNNEQLTVSLDFPSRTVYAQVWEASIGRIKLYLLDTDITLNSPIDREITARLYGGDQEMRIQQEMFLGIGGLKALEELGIQPTIYHMNEGHCAFLTLELMRQLVVDKKISFKNAKEIVSSCTVFTTHTPVPAGIDIFPVGLIDKYFSSYWNQMNISRHEFMELGMSSSPDSGQSFNMGFLALKIAGKKNGVSELHGQVSREIFGDVWPNVPKEEVPISHVTNGIHTFTWLAPDLKDLFLKYMTANWETNISHAHNWDGIDRIPDNEFWEVHQSNKKRLFDLVHANMKKQLKRNGATPHEIMNADKLLDPNVLTIGFARRFATYKRANLIFRDIERIKRIFNNPDMPVQIIFAGKAHPADRPGQEIIKNIYDISKSEGFNGKVILLENYNMEVSRYMLQGVDIWMNNPRRPLEASGTSGEKAAINGAINFSVLDGWWIEGYNGENGWSIGKEESYSSLNHQDNVDSDSIYTTLENDILPLYYYKDENGLPTEWIKKMKTSIRTIAPQFSTERMLKDYTNDMYIPQVNRYWEISQNDFSEANSITEWKNYMEQNWNTLYINPLNLDAYSHTPILVNDTIAPACLAYLGNVNPDDVSVEVYYGKLTDNNHIVDSHVAKMNLIQKNGDVYEYRTELPMKDGGSYGFTYRIVPKSDKLINKHDMGLIKWVMNK